MQKNIKPKRVLSVFSLVMINVIAVDSLKSIPLTAKLGPSLIFYYALFSICFFFPVALITAELATTFPERGGIYVWVREAFGNRVGFLVAWLQWIYNVVWYPTVLGVVAALVAYIVAPGLQDNPWFTLTVILVVFWGATFINCFGMELSSLISTLGSVLGTLLPIFLIIGLGYWWHISNHISEYQFTINNILPTVNGISDLTLGMTILFSLMGLEMSAVHALEVKNPSKDFPKALLISSWVIVLSLVFASMAVVEVVPMKHLHVMTGMLQAFEIFLKVFNLESFLPVLTVLILFGLIGSVATWIIGPAKSLEAAALDGSLPLWLEGMNNKGVPIKILFAQAIITSILASAYVLLPSVESAYFILTALTTILGLLMYILFFAAGIKLRYSHRDIQRPYCVPFGKLGLWVTAGLGIITCAIAALISCLPPSQISVGNPIHYQIVLLFGIIMMCLPVLWIKSKST